MCKIYEIWNQETGWFDLAIDCTEVLHEMLVFILITSIFISTVGVFWGQNVYTGALTSSPIRSQLFYTFGYEIIYNHIYIHYSIYTWYNFRKCCINTESHTTIVLYIRRVALLLWPDIMYFISTIPQTACLSAESPGWVRPHKSLFHFPSHSSENLMLIEQVIYLAEHYTYIPSRSQHL